MMILPPLGLTHLAAQAIQGIGADQLQELPELLKQQQQDHPQDDMSANPSPSL